MNRKKNQRRKPTKRRKAQRTVQTLPKYQNINKNRPKTFLHEGYVKNLLLTVIQKKPTNPFQVLMDEMPEFSELFGKLTNFQKVKSFEELFKILDVNRVILKKDKKKKLNFKNSIEMVEPKTITDILEFVRKQISEREFETPYQVSLPLLQTCAILSRLGKSKHLRELTVSNRSGEIFCEILGSEIGYGERLLVLDVLSFLTEQAYLNGMNELKRRYRIKKEREKQKKEKKEIEKREKKEEKMKEKASEKKGKKKEESEEEEEEEEEGESSEEEEDDDDEEDEDEYMKKQQAKRIIKDDDLFESILCLQDCLTSVSTLQSLSNSLYLPPARVCKVCAILSLKILFKLLVGAYEDRDHFEKLSYEAILGKDVDFAFHFERILGEYVNNNNEQQQQQQEEEEEEENNDIRVTIKMGNDSESLSYLLSCLFYLAENPSKKIHRKLSRVYELLIEIVQSQTEKFQNSKKKPGEEEKKEIASLDWNLLSSICGVIAKIGGENPHLARYFADYLIEDMILLVEYSHRKQQSNLECYSALTVLLGRCNSIEMKQYLEETSLIKHVTRDLLKGKTVVEKYYPPLLCLKIILGVFAPTSSNSNLEDNLYAMQLIIRHHKVTHRVFQLATRILKWMEQRQKEYREEMEARKNQEKQQNKKGGKQQPKKRRKKTHLTDEEIIQRDKESKFGWPCLITTIHILWNCRNKMNRISDRRGMDEGIKKFDEMLDEKKEHAESLLRISQDVSKQKKKAFSYKKVLILFVLIVGIILILPLSYSFLGLSAGKDKKKIPGGRDDGE